MNKFQYAKKMEDEAEKVVTMTEIDNWSPSFRVKSFRDREDPIGLETFRRRDAWKRKAKEELATTEAKRIKEKEAVEVAELIDIFKKHIDDDEDKDMVLGLDLHSMPTQKLTKEAVLVEEATEVKELIDIFQKHIDEEEDTVFGLDLHSLPTQKLVVKPAILPPTNRLSSTPEMNQDIISKIPGNKLRLYYSADSIASEGPSDAFNYPPEFLYSLTPPGLPPHVLELKLGIIVMLLVNLNPKEGLCNGTRLVIKSLQNHLITAEIVTECNRGDLVFIPRIDFRSDHGLPFMLKRRQFPIVPAYAIKTDDQ